LGAKLVVIRIEMVLMRLLIPYLHTAKIA